VLIKNYRYAACKTKWLALFLTEHSSRRVTEAFIRWKHFIKKKIIAVDILVRIGSKCDHLAISQAFVRWHQAIRWHVQRLRDWNCKLKIAEFIVKLIHSVNRKNLKQGFGVIKIHSDMSSM